MSPLDDELRAALHGRASVLAPAADPLSGIERRAKQIRRNRVGAAVVSSALAVAAIAVAVPAVQNATSSAGPDVPRVATTAEPTVAPEPVSSYELDPTDPWEYRGDPSLVVDREVATYTREWATARGLSEEQVTWTPLFGQVWEPSGQSEVVYVATDDTGEHFWGVVTATESGPEFVFELPLERGTMALVAPLAGDEVERVLVTAAPEASAFRYSPDGRTWTTIAGLEPGVATTAREGDPQVDRIEVRDADGQLVHDSPVPPGQHEAEHGGSEGPGSDETPQVDTAQYAFDLDDPWSYRGPAELTQHPSLATEDERLFVQGGTGRGDGSWSQRPLFAAELPDGLSVLMVLHTSGERAVVTTTSQRQDEAARQSEQPVEDGMLLLQSFLPQSDGTGIAIALADPDTGAVETTVRGAQRLAGEEDFALWSLPPQPGQGEVFLYSGGDGLQYHSEPARIS